LQFLGVMTESTMNATSCNAIFYAGATVAILCLPSVSQKSQESHGAIESGSQVARARAGHGGSGSQGWLAVWLAGWLELGSQLRPWGQKTSENHQTQSLAYRFVFVRWPWPGPKNRAGRPKTCFSFTFCPFGPRASAGSQPASRASQPARQTASQPINSRTQRATSTGTLKIK